MENGKSARHRVRFFLIVAAILGGYCIMVAFNGFLGFLQERWVGTVSVSPSPVTAADLNLPDAGFYRIHGFLLSDDMDCAQQVRESFSWDEDTRLSLVEINLQNYRDRALNLQVLSLLFGELRTLDRQYIVRFVYDWDGKNMEVEPTNRHTVEEHMQQAMVVLEGNQDIILTLQGLFVGNWGEMNGTRYTGAENWQALFDTLFQATSNFPDGPFFLAVRTPAQWRASVNWAGSVADTLSADPRARWLGLFNDGMLGSESDLGTYGTGDGSDPLSSWSREQELAFQDELCRLVPNGGEVVKDTPYNDFPAAVKALSRMHVTYLNRDYDKAVLDKWAAATVEEPGPWQGMDGLTYMERHLGYRYAVSAADLHYDYWRNALSGTVTLENQGFAPAYVSLKTELYLEDSNRSRWPLNAGGEMPDLRQLAGGGECLTQQVICSLKNVPQGECRVYVAVSAHRGAGEGWVPVPLANENWDPDHGTEIGRIEPK